VAIAIAGNLRQSGSRIVGFCAATQEQGRIGSRVMGEETREFEAGLAGRAENRGIKFGPHQICFKSLRASFLVIFVVEAYLSIILHKYSYILNRLGELSSQNRESGKPGVPRHGKTGKPRLYKKHF
jgi:hypothetical protein